VKQWFATEAQRSDIVNHMRGGKNKFAIREQMTPSTRLRHIPGAMRRLLQNLSYDDGKGSGKR
jgi:hypothetical protein